VTVETPPAAPEAQPTGRRCPRCGAAMTDQQEWCLNCGAAVGTHVVAAPGWRTPIAIAGVILALAAIAVAVAIVQLADDTGEVAQDPPAQAATPAEPPATTPAPTPEGTLTPDPTLPEASGQETPEPTTTPDSPGGGGSSSGSGGGDATWPASKSGWTVVLASDTSESDARDKAEDFASDGISGVGVLDSDDFSSLRGGFWVVFAGQYDSQAEASDALDGIDAKDAYIRRIEPA
jgi:septal ring-binding cell division protein DamX